MATVDPQITTVRTHIIEAIKLSLKEAGVITTALATNGAWGTPAKAAYPLGKVFGGVSKTLRSGLGPVYVMQDVVHIAIAPFSNEENWEAVGDEVLATFYPAVDTEFVRARMDVFLRNNLGRISVQEASIIETSLNVPRAVVSITLAVDYRPTT